MRKIPWRSEPGTSLAVIETKGGESTDCVKKFSLSRLALSFLVESLQERQIEHVGRV
jgi:hypothetical protein